MTIDYSALLGAMTDMHTINTRDEMSMSVVVSADFSLVPIAITVVTKMYPFRIILGNRTRRQTE